jgi:hypothetical protein|nr:MAG TPA: hypothetical protein [Caudoviricetes sp.]
MNTVNGLTTLTHERGRRQDADDNKRERFSISGGETHHPQGGVPKTDTPEASPHALPIAPTRANRKWNHLRAILWGLGLAFMQNPNTFTFQH